MLTLVRLFGLSGTYYRAVHFFLCVLGVVIASVIVAFFIHEGHSRAAIVSGIVLALALLVVTDQLDHIPNKLLEKFGFGQKNVQFIVTEEGYRALKAAGVVTGSLDISGPKPVDDVQILCRMGPNYFVIKSGKRMTIRKADVISWSVTSP